MTRLILGYEVLRSYKRLSYTPWHALAEFVDNSTQAYFNHQATLDAIYKEMGTTLRVDIVYDSTADLIRVSDNSIGMNVEDLDRAMELGLPPPNPEGRSRYGMGLKTAACWLGDLWTVRTSKLGDPVEKTITVDVDRVAGGDSELPEEIAAVAPETHYTVIDIRQLHRQFYGRTLGKIKSYLASMYRQDLRRGLLTLTWQDEALRWESADDRLLRDRDGEEYRKEFEYEIDNKPVWGWAGVLRQGSRSQAGFSILHSGRVVKGWPQSWRPQEVYGQIEGSNDLVNQRVVGEIHLDNFDVTHTKDDVLWQEGEEEEVQRRLRAEIDDIVFVARNARTRDKAGPGAASARRTTREIQQRIREKPVPMPRSDPAIDEITLESSEAIAKRYVLTRPDISGSLYGKPFHAYITDDEDSGALFAAVDKADDSDELIVVVANLRHPFLREVTSSESLSIYLRLLLVDLLAYEVSDQWSQVPEWLTLRDKMMRSWSDDDPGGT